ncbi:hypothetical protein GHT06_016566 [Daphnia sinensis]|uniref:Dynein axonemal assembly factor 1 homolog n=1 Tax=Daphnia sinensis TaxID=1820382 RepID=A0AAD5L7K5_9CRUS|nr:hypothetical protein GHT06_016566 [Daphnia sinensis]
MEEGDDKKKKLKKKGHISFTSSSNSMERHLHFPKSWHILQTLRSHREIRTCSSTPIAPALFKSNKKSNKRKVGLSQLEPIQLTASGSLSNLRSGRADACGLPCVPSLKGRENVQFISLQHNLICRIDSLSSFRMLKVLNLYDNKIERISGLDTLASLRVLMLGKNRLKTTEGLESLQSLDILDLHGNQIAALTGMSRLRTLRVLNLAANSLKKLPSLDGLLALEELNAKRNRICKIVPEVAHAKRLERLYLSNNELRRLDDLSPLSFLNGLKELSLDGNPLTFNANYVLYAVSSMRSLVLLDQNVISCGLRAEAENWSSQRLPASSTASGQMDKINPIVTVQHKASASGVAIGTIKSSGMSSKFHQRNVAVVRPMSTTNQPEQEQHNEPPPQPEGLTAQVGSPPTVNDHPAHPPRCSSPVPMASAIKSCLVRSGDHPRRKSFRQIAFSAMVCNAAAPRPADDSQDKSSQPVFRFSLRPPTAEWNETIEQRTTGKRTNSSCSRRRDRSRVAIEFDDSSSSWNSDSDDSDTASTASTQSRKPAARLPCRVSTAPTSSSGTTTMNLTRSVTSSASKSPTSLANQKLSANIGMNIKEQLRDLRIIVGDEEVHITGVNIVRMLQNMQWSPDEVELFHMIVFYGLSFDQLCPHYASIRKLFPNLRNFAFRKMAIPPTLRQINALAKLESPSWFRWTLSVETLVPTPEPLKAAWKMYAIYRLHPFGLDQIDGEPIGPDDVAKAEDHYDTLDALVLLTAPSTAIRRQFDRFYDAGQSPSSSSSGSSDVGGQQQQQSRDNEYSLLMRKRAIRATFQPFKETKHLRNRTAHLKYIAEYGMEVAIKLSFLSQNWERLFSDMVETAADEVQDEAAYKRTKMAQMRSNTNA